MWFSWCTRCSTSEVLPGTMKPNWYWFFTAGPWANSEESFIAMLLRNIKPSRGHFFDWINFGLNEFQFNISKCSLRDSQRNQADTSWNELQCRDWKFSNTRLPKMPVSYSNLFCHEDQRSSRSICTWIAWHRSVCRMYSHGQLDVEL